VARVVAGLGDYVTAAIVFTVSVLVGLVARALLKRSIRLWAERSATKMDDVIVGAIDKPIIAWFILGGVYASLPYLDLSPPLLTTAERGLLISLILSVSWALANIAGGVVRFYGSRIGAGLQVSSLGQVLAKVAILTLGIVIILAELGIEVTPPNRLAGDRRPSYSPRPPRHPREHLLWALRPS
jgi:TM2 domain-containing membrane protein YozV